MKALFKKLASLLRLKVQNGPLKNYRLIAGSGIKFLRGKYEEETINYFLNNIEEGYVCYDIGGHIGYTGLILSKLSGGKGRVLVFEPRPINISYIQKHISINNVTNIVLLTIGVSDYEGETSFDVERGTGTGKISEHGTLTIKVDSLDNLYNKGEIIPPDFIKMDIEGEELKALMGGENILKRFKPILNVSTHGTAVHNSCVEYVKELGYLRIEDIKGGFTAH